MAGSPAFQSAPEPSAGRKREVPAPETRRGGCRSRPHVLAGGTPPAMHPARPRAHLKHTAPAAALLPVSCSRPWTMTAGYLWGVATNVGGTRNTTVEAEQMNASDRNACGRRPPRRRAGGTVWAACAPGGRSAGASFPGSAALDTASFGFYTAEESQNAADLGPLAPAVEERRPASRTQIRAGGGQAPCCPRSAWLLLLLRKLSETSELWGGRHDPHRGSVSVSAGGGWRAPC